MKLIRTFYKTSSLAKNGVFILIVAVVLLVIGSFFIPEFEGTETEGQIYNLNGFNLKFDDKAETNKFYQSIIKNDGYLVLGTSESTGAANYFDFLNNDPEIKTRFSVLAGAGRTCGVHIPILKNQGENVKSLKIIYYINPAYWRSNLCNLDRTYWDRYTDYSMSIGLNLTEEEAKLYGEPIEKYAESLNPLAKSTRLFENAARNFRHSYFHDLYYHLNPDKFEEQFLYIPETKNNLAEHPEYSNPDLSDHDTVWNIPIAFTHIQGCREINTSTDFRYNELNAFIELCKELQIETTFIIGPYNSRFIQQNDPSSLSEYPRWINRVQSILEEHNVDYINATDISQKVGAFKDFQHHSSFGAHLIYEKLKSHLNEK